MHATAVLLLTHDHALWDHWRSIDADDWMPARGQTMDDLIRWRDQGRRLVLLDAGLPRLPDWNDPVWRQHFTDLRIVVGTMRTSDTEGRDILAAGGSGYIHAYTPAKALNTILETVSAGSVWLGPTLLARLLRDIDQRLPRQASGTWADSLTAREKEVAERAAIGHSNQAIADALSISERTVRAHLSAVFEKLGVADRLLLALKVHGIQ